MALRSVARWPGKEKGAGGAAARWRRLAASGSVAATWGRRRGASIVGGRPASVELRAAATGGEGLTGPEAAAAGSGGGLVAWVASGGGGAGASAGEHGAPDPGGGVMRVAWNGASEGRPAAPGSFRRAKLGRRPAGGGSRASGAEGAVVADVGEGRSSRCCRGKARRVLQGGRRCGWRTWGGEARCCGGRGRRELGGRRLSLCSPAVARPAAGRRSDLVEQQHGEARGERELRAKLAAGWRRRPLEKRRTGARAARCWARSDAPVT